MKKLRLKALGLGAKEILTREQLKYVLGGSGGSGTGGGGGDTGGGSGGQCYNVSTTSMSSCYYSTAANSATLCQRVYPGQLCVVTLANINGSCEGCQLN